MIVSSSATRIRIPAILGGEANLGAGAALSGEGEGAPELVAHERADDREARPLARLGREPRPVVGDLEHDLAVVGVDADPDMLAAVLERVPEQLGEDERERR